MVMKRNAMAQNLRMSIRRSFGRYFAIVMIIALGAALFLGLLVTRTDMLATGQAYMDQQNMFDFRILTNYGWTEEYVQKISQLEEVGQAEGLFYLDLIARTGDSTDDNVYRFYSIPEKINQLALRGGRWPEKPDECLADGFKGGEELLGKTVTVSSDNAEDSLDALTAKTFTVVGYVATPLYMDINRGTTTVGSGSLSNYFFVPDGAFDVDYYTEINITLPQRYPVYSAQYEKAVEAASDALEPKLKELARQRYEEIKEDAEKEYNDGYREYLDGMQEYRDGAEDAEKELRDAWQELRDGEKEIEDNRAKLRRGGREIEAGQRELEQKQAELNAALAQFREQKPAALAALAEAKAELDQNMAQLKPLYEPAVAGKATMEKLKNALAGAQDQIQGEMAVIQGKLDDPEIPDEDKAGLPERYDLLSKQLTVCKTSISELDKQIGNAQQVIDGYDAIQAGYAELENQKAQLEAAEAQLEDGQRQIDEARDQLKNAYNQLMVGWGLLHQGEKDLEDGWKEFEDGKAEAKQELLDAQVELRDARAELADARAELDDLEEGRLYLLDRTGNVGYNNLDSSTGILAGVARVLPAFFLLVAALVCITTMTRMIDEERTQIGTLKALGYSEGAIIGKYLAYSGTGAIIGCVLGMLAGGVLFPKILWQAYCILLYIQPDVILTLDWPRGLLVTVLYTGLMLLVTWYSCHRTLRENPAELIRPKSPDAGKKILLEYLPLWNQLPFLEKVSIRNIFRYRQRLAMMLVGIGGCTALLLTGFGLRDSIVNVVDYQFSEVALYDMTVYFREGQTGDQQQRFTKKIAEDIDQVVFYHQSSAEVLFEDKLKSVYLMAGGNDLADCIKFHSRGQLLPMPGEDEVLLTVGAAKALGAGVGDQVTIRNADLQTMELTVSGVYDNHLHNYAIVSPAAMEKAWGSLPEQQMANLIVRENTDVHRLGAKISDMTGVMNIIVSEDMAESVSGMMDAMDMVVWVIVFCAGLLAITVVYNLTNININERIREIATIKVLGFNAAETAAYVFKENMTLTVVGALLGLPMGLGLLTFVMSQIKIDLVWFKALANPKSYLLSIALTLLSAMVVNFIFYFKLEKINMAEALKSVE